MVRAGDLVPVGTVLVIPDLHHHVFEERSSLLS